jgi:hypothetical protein
MNEDQQCLESLHPTRPKTVDVEEITAHHLELCPTWAAAQVQPGSRWTRPEWENCAYTFRLLTLRTRVLAPQLFSKG